MSMTVYPSCKASAIVQVLIFNFTSIIITPPLIRVLAIRSETNHRAGGCSLFDAEVVNHMVNASREYVMVESIFPRIGGGRGYQKVLMIQPNTA